MPDPDTPRPPNPERPRTLREVVAEDPEARRMVGRVYAELLAVLLVAIAGISGLLLWHLARRGRILRSRLSQPRPVDWPDDAKNDDDRDRLGSTS